jgi:hypothetical protein
MKKYSNKELVDFLDSELATAPNIESFLKGSELELNTFRIYVEKLKAIREIPKYLLELIQMDLNFGRRETILARARAARNNILGLIQIFEKDVPLEEKDFLEYYYGEGYVEEPPREQGLWLFTSAHHAWEPRHAAIYLNDYRDFILETKDWSGQLEVFLAINRGLLFKHA